MVVVSALLALSAPAAAAPASPFKKVATGKGVFAVQSDGARFAWGQPQGGRAVRVFDTLRGRNFRVAAPAPGCEFVAIGGGFALWACPRPTNVLLTNLLTGRSREPVGIDELRQKDAAELPYGSCGPPPYGPSVGHYWLGFACVSAWGYRGEPPFFLNLRTGRLTNEINLDSPDLPFIDPDFVGLFRRYCAPLDAPQATRSFDYAPPFLLQTEPGMGPRIGSILLRRCGSSHTEVLSRCPQTDCRTPQLGSGYVTWGEFKRVYAYLPRIRRRVLVGRAPEGFLRGRKLSVAHTCNRIFARWGFTIYEARFEPRRGGPRCQSAR